MANILYLIAAVCFIFSLKGLSSAESSRNGNICGICGMALACVATYVKIDPACLSINPWFTISAVVIGGAIGILIAKNVSMTSLPQMIAGFHTLVGMAAVLIAFSVYCAPKLFGIMSLDDEISTLSLAEMCIGTAIGAITFSGSMVAFLKLQGVYKGHKVPLPLNAFLLSSIVCLIVHFVISQRCDAFLLVTIFSFIFGATLIMPIGGADMPVVVSMLNSYSGWAASGIGFTLHNDLLIITGALVGSSGAILSYIMCKGMNRSLIEVIFSSGYENLQAASASSEIKPFKKGSPEDAAFVLKNASSVIVVPGYGMATSQAQHALKEMVDLLKKQNVNVKYAIHPVAGRMPGHMNVLLAEANVPYEDVFELDEINRDFASCDVAYVIGANDVTNPAAKKNQSSPIYGMPILDVEKAKSILFLKRSMGAGYAGIDNELFYAQNTMMLLGDAKKMTEAIAKAM
ncbi:MAG: NAD(P)(+) transhydrogenase (Re/Si-specific) subunit beta [Holosporaceae bacterium]|jgi:NAD(P) transhydrogenase subunit beta|nr:NAD(P)(+) transhydrogenase (Re/Si-specific) subunit beta [Holosporaceae bacterium]